MFCTLRLIFSGTEGVGACFRVFRSRTRFRRYRGRPIPFSCFALPDMFSTVSSASGPIFMFCAPRLIFTNPEGDRFRLHVLRAGTYFWRYGGRRVPFSCLARLHSFWRYRVRRFSFSCFTRSGVGSRFHILRYQTRIRRYRRG
jgi:hypothetical protein